MPRESARLGLLALEWMFAALCVVFVLVNVKHAQTCGGQKSDAAARREALEHRLEAMETEVKENSHALHDLLERLEARFGVSDLVDFRQLKRECHVEAAAIVAHLAEDHPPPMPQFATQADEFSTTRADDAYVDDVLKEGGGDDRYGAPEGDARGGGSGYDDRVVDLPSTEARSEKCRDWRATYAVSPGASWGTLPLDLQQTWRDYDCDVFLQDAVQGMLADGAAHEERADWLEARPQRDDFDDDFVGDIQSVEGGGGTVADDKPPPGAGWLH